MRLPFLEGQIVDAMIWNALPIKNEFLISKYREEIGLVKIKSNCRQVDISYYQF